MKAGPHLARGPARPRGAAITTGPLPAGFTLVEVLVALAIVAIALAAGARAASSLTDSAQRLTEVTAGHWCASNQLAALKLARQFPGVGDSDFTCQQLGRDYAGKLAVRPLANQNFRVAIASVLNEQGHVVARLSMVVSRY